MRKDDVVVRIGGRDVSDLQATVEAVRSAKPGGKLDVRVRRGSEEMDLTVRVGLVPFEVLAELN